MSAGCPWRWTCSCRCRRRYAGNGGAHAEAPCVGACRRRCRFRRRNTHRLSPWGFEESSPSARRWNKGITLLGGGPGAASAGEVERVPPASSGRGLTRTGAASWPSTSWLCPEPGVPFAWEWGLPRRAAVKCSLPPSRPIRVREALAAGRRSAETAKRAYETRRPNRDGAFSGEFGTYCWRPLRNESLRKLNAFRLATLPEKVLRSCRRRR